MYSTVNIAIADDSELFREGLKMLLHKQGEFILVGEAKNGRELLDLVETTCTDIVITDIIMPGIDGIELTAQLAQKHPEIGIIAITMHNEDRLIVDMLEAGARGYIVKNTSREELVQAVKIVSDGGTYFCNTTSARLTKLIATSNLPFFKDQPKPRFNKRELEIIDLICKELPSKQIAATLHLSHRTVENYREKIQKKTGAKNMVGIAVYAIRHRIFRV